MGCLRNIIKITVISFAVIGFLSVGGREFMNEKITPHVKNFNQNFKIELEKKNKDVKELSLNELKDVFIVSLQKTFSKNEVKGDYEVTSVKGMMGYDAEIAQNLKTGQKMITVDTKDKIKPNLAQTDRTELKNELLEIAKKHKNIPIKFDNFDIVDQGKWKIAGTEQNYVTISVKDKMTGKDIKAIVSSSAEDSSKIFVTFGPNENFSVDLAKKYWK